MKKHLPLVSVLLLSVITGSFAQMDQFQYFDGADTAQSNSILIGFDSDPGNVWQIGPPQKIIFSGPATTPNVLVTDTINSYPVNNTSTFSFMLIPSWWGPGILALQWKQKLDMEQGKDGGIIEFSSDNGLTWNNVFNSPYTYNFYGFYPSNKDTLVTGDYAFSGTDSVWRDIWLCFDNSFLMGGAVDTVLFKFTLKSDSIQTNQEGWMIDNMYGHITIMHTVKEEQSEYLKVFPTVTSGTVNIQAQKLLTFHVIESMELFDASGKTVQRFGLSPTKYSIDIGNHANGTYYLKINTNLKSQTFPIILNKK